jgi:colanic acid biosynthesis glycosyl transferase WcaI
MQHAAPEAPPRPGSRPRPARLVFVNRFYAPDLAATSQMLGGIAPGLAARGLAIVVVTSRQRYEDAAANLPAREVLDAVEVRRVWSTRFGRLHPLGRLVDYLSFHASVLVELLRLLRAGDLVVAMTDPPMLSVTVWAASRLRGARLLNWLQDLFPEVARELGFGSIPGAVHGLLLALRDRSLRGAECNVTLGERMRDHVAARGVAPARLAVIPNWADGAAIRPMATELSRLRHRLGLGGRFVVGYSGNLGMAHDVDALLVAARELRDDDSLVFVLSGGGSGMRRLQREAQADDLPNLRFLPYQSAADLGDSLAAANVHLVSLRPELEGLIVPSKTYGVLAAGRAVAFVGDSDGEIARLLRRHGCGVTVDSGARLAQALRMLRAEPSTVESMGLRARTAFDAEFSRSTVVEHWHALLARGFSHR